MPRLRRIEALLIALIGIKACAAGEMREAPNPAAAPVNQLSVSGNACGPAALLASCRFGNESWQAAANSLAGSNDKERLTQWIKRFGLRPSATLKGRMRWSNSGINVEDLVTAANEMNRPLYLPTLASDDLFKRKGEKPEELLKRTRACLDESLSKGFPPVLSLRRFALRKGVWTPVQGHFVTVIGVQRKIAKGATEIRISYLDPFGGKRCEGTLKAADRAVLAENSEESPCLIAEVPASKFGRKDVTAGEATVVVPSAVIGRW
jgi:hypothetical protein